MSGVFQLSIWLHYHTDHTDTIPNILLCYPIKKGSTIARNVKWTLPGVQIILACQKSAKQIVTLKHL